MNTLTGKQTRFLRSIGHHLRPLVMVGAGMISEPLIASAEANLQAHELIKVKIQPGCELDRGEVAQILAQRTGAEIVQVLGGTILLYRENKDKNPDNKIHLP